MAMGYLLKYPMDPMDMAFIPQNLHSHGLAILGTVHIGLDGLNESRTCEKIPGVYLVCCMKFGNGSKMIQFCLVCVYKNEMVH